MLPDSFGNSLLAIIRHDGQHEVAMKRCSVGTFSRKSRASSIAQMSRRDLDHVGETERLHRRDEFRRRHVLAELPGK